jgi:hypothetical protein
MVIPTLWWFSGKSSDAQPPSQEEEGPSAAKKGKKYVSPQRNGRGLLPAPPIRHYVGSTQQANPRRTMA